MKLHFTFTIGAHETDKLLLKTRMQVLPERGIPSRRFYSKLGRVAEPAKVNRRKIPKKRSVICEKRPVRLALINRMLHYRWPEITIRTYKKSIRNNQKCRWRHWRAI